MEFLAGSERIPQRQHSEMGVAPPKLKRRLSVDEQDSMATKESMSAKSKPEALTTAQVATNFGLVGISCTCAQSTVHWTQTAMVRQQLTAMGGGERLSFPAQVTRIMRDEGVSGLYRGFSAAAVREMSYSTLRFVLHTPS